MTDEPTTKQIMTVAGKVAKDKEALLSIFENNLPKYNRFLAILKDTLATEKVKIDGKDVPLAALTDPVTINSIGRAIAKACYYGLSIGRATGESWLVPKGFENGSRTYQLYIGRNGYVKRAKEDGIIYDARVIPISVQQKDIVIRHTNNGDAFTYDRAFGQISYLANGRQADVFGYLVELIVPGAQPHTRRSEIVPVPLAEITRINKFAKVGEYQDKDKKARSAHDQFEDKMDEKTALVIALKPKFAGTMFSRAVIEQDEQEHDYEQRIEPDRFTRNLDTRVKELGGEDGK